MKSLERLRLFEFDKDFESAKKRWARLLIKPFAVLVLFCSIMTIFLGILGLFLPVVPGVLLISVGVSLMFYAVDRLQP